MTEVITNLHPEGDSNTILRPNVVDANIPANISRQDKENTFSGINTFTGDTNLNKGASIPLDVSIENDTNVTNKKYVDDSASNTLASAEKYADDNFAGLKKLNTFTQVQTFRNVVNFNLGFKTYQSQVDGLANFNGDTNLNKGASIPLDVSIENDTNVTNKKYVDEAIKNKLIFERGTVVYKDGNPVEEYKAPSEESIYFLNAEMEKSTTDGAILHANDVSIYQHVFQEFYITFSELSNLQLLCTAQWYSLSNITNFTKLPNYSKILNTLKIVDNQTITTNIIPLSLYLQKVPNENAIYARLTFYREGVLNSTLTKVDMTSYSELVFKM